MSIIRAPRPEVKFYILDKSISEDKRLGWAARGFLIYLLGKPDHWQVSVQALVNEVSESSEKSARDRTYSLINQLIESGYISRSQRKGHGGKFTSCDYVVSESPLTANPYTAKPLTVKPTLVSIDSNQVLKKQIKTDLKKNTCPPQAKDEHLFKFSEIQDAYNRICSPSLPKCAVDNKARRAQVKQMVDLEFNGKKPFREFGMKMWESYFNDCLTNPHWVGDNDRGWKADFDFVTKPKNAIKLLERLL